MANKKQTKGGFQDPIRPDTGPKLVMWYIVHRLGGPTKAAELCNKSSATVFQWRYRGQVPLKETRRVAKAWKVSAWALNYEDIAEFTGKAPVWNEAVLKFGLTPDEVDQVLYLEPPHVPLDVVLVEEGKK